MTDHNQDRSQDEGQQGIDRETEKRNRENETGQQGQQNSDQSPSDQDRGSSAFGQQGQSAGGDTTLQGQSGQQPDQQAGQESGQQQSGGQSGSGFVGTKGDQSSDYLTKGEEGQDFASQGQGAQDTDAGTADIETGQCQQGSDDSELDDGSDNSR